MSALVWQIIYQSGPDKINLNRPLVFMFFWGGEEKPKQTVQLKASGTSCVSCSGHRGQQWAGGRVQRDTKKSLQPKGCKHPGQKYFQWLRDFFFLSSQFLFYKCLFVLNRENCGEHVVCTYRQPRKTLFAHTMDRASSWSSCGSWKSLMFRRMNSLRGSQCFSLSQ